MPERETTHRKRKKQRLAAHTRSCLLWGLTFFAAAHFGMLIATQSFWPHLRDPEYGYKLSSLRRQLHEGPDRPLLVLLGSSRTGQGVRPGVMPDLPTPDGRIPLVFNFSQVGSGPLAEFVILHRLLDAGIRPNWLAVEILPALLGRTVDAFGDCGISISRMSCRDVLLLNDYVHDPEQMRHRWFKDQAWPWYAQRFTVMNHYASNCVPWRLRLDHWKQLDQWGWSDIGEDNQPLVLNPTALEVTRQTYLADLKHLRISSMQDHALRDLIALCKQHDIALMFYIMPEGTIFRGWYAPEVSERINTYLTRLSRETGVPIVDLRAWMQDKYFGDSHHLYRRGATMFSQRFAPEVLGYLVQGKPESLPCLMTPLSSPGSEPEAVPGPLTVLPKSPSQTKAATLSINGGPPPTIRGARD
ncbi:MAG TPA: hypothetical protein VH592_18780 [Gemmataceae bacterium]|jgi:hypothetical protein